MMTKVVVGVEKSAVHRKLLMLPIASEPMQRKDVNGIVG